MDAFHPIMPTTLGDINANFCLFSACIFATITLACSALKFVQDSTTTKPSSHSVVGKRRKKSRARREHTDSGLKSIESVVVPPQDICCVEEDPVCCICLVNLDNTADILICKHTFHSQCIQEWLKYSRWCPLCRQDVGENRRKLAKCKFYFSEPFINVCGWFLILCLFLLYVYYCRVM